MIYMIAVEDEPGGIPILLVVLGIGWYLITRFRIRSHYKVVSLQRDDPPSQDQASSALPRLKQLPPNVSQD